jgi:peptidyl-dipeptidase Dcp
LGYTTHAHFVLEERMAESPESYRSSQFITKQNQLKKEFADLQAFAKETDGIEQLENGMVVILKS